MESKGFITRLLERALVGKAKATPKATPKAKAKALGKGQRSLFTQPDSCVSRLSWSGEKALDFADFLIDGLCTGRAYGAFDYRLASNCQNFKPVNACSISNSGIGL
ncbi:MAG TPA: hypothetical protein VFR24_09850 [Candidatus Angelobacter sp.]|nr:hypothetical protein [Candidatus Angelobacter sp.]